MVLDLRVEPLMKLQDDVSPLEIVSVINEFAKIVDVFIDGARPLEVLRGL